MSIPEVTNDIRFQLGGMIDDNGGDYKVFALDIGEVYLSAADGKFYLLSVNEIKHDAVAFIEANDWE